MAEHDGSHVLSAISLARNLKRRRKEKKFNRFDMSERANISPSFYSELETTRGCIERALPQLRQQLVGAGFSTGEFHSFAGKTVSNEPPSVAAFAESLLDLEA